MAKEQQKKDDNKQQETEETKKKALTFTQDEDDVEKPGAVVKVKLATIDKGAKFIAAVLKKASEEHGMVTVKGTLQLFGPGLGEE